MSAQWNKDKGEDAGKEADGRLWRVPEWFSDFSAELLGKLRVYHIELIRFNGRMNLIAASTERNADQQHFSDSILGGRIILNATKASQIHDIGSGNGFPGIVMAAMAPDREFIMIDKDARKVEFIRHVAARMELSNVSARQLQVEELPDGSVECAVTRGFANISKTIVALRKQTLAKAEVFHFKGNSWVREVGDIPAQICSLWAPSLVSDYELPDNGPKHSIILTQRI